MLLENEVVTKETLSERDSPQFAQPPATWRFVRAQPGSKCRLILTWQSNFKDPTFLTPAMGYAEKQPLSRSITQGPTSWQK